MRICVWCARQHHGVLESRLILPDAIRLGVVPKIEEAEIEKYGLCSSGCMDRCFDANKAVMARQAS